MKRMTMKSIRNQDQSTEILIPRTRKRVKDLPPPNICPWYVDSVPGSMATDQKWLRERLEELERIDRPSASEGERRAAEWLVAQFRELGAEARIEAENAPGTYWG